MRTPSATLGVLVVQHYEDSTVYTERDLDFLTSVGGHIALAIERKEADDALRKQQEEQQIIFHSAPLMILYKDRENRILRANRAAALANGVEVEELEGRTRPRSCPEHAQKYHRDDLEVIQIRPAQTRNSRGISIAVRRNPHAAHGQDSLSRSAWEHHRRDCFFDGRHGKATTPAKPCGDRKQIIVPSSRMRLTASAGRARRERLLDVNPALVEMLGYASEVELLGMDLVAQVFADPAYARQTLAEAEGRNRDAETDWKKRDGTSIRVRLSVRLVRAAESPSVYYELVAENITERRALETQLRQAVKMEAIGRLAGGVAHDFNNILMVIKGHAELLLERVGSDQWALQKVEQVQRAADRAAALTRQLLAFSRMQLLQPRVIDLNVVVAEMGRLLPRLIGEDIDLTVRLRPDLGRVKADQTQIEQVIMNLAVNARDAMPDGGKLLIETSNVELDEAYARRHPPLSAGHFAMLAVTDSGVGMDAETQAHIFEPFFTTKEKGKGTGLGLATVYGVVKQSGGYVWVYSEKNRGTTFKIYLPRVDDPVDASRGADVGRGNSERPRNNFAGGG